MNTKPITSKLLVVLGAFTISIMALVGAPPAGAYPGHGQYGGACVNGYQLVKQYPDPRSPDVCALPTNVAGMEPYVYVNSYAVNITPPGWRIPWFAALDASLPPCGQFDPATYPPPGGRPYCAPGWVPVGFR